MVAAGHQQIDPGSVDHQNAVRLVEGDISAAAGQAEAGLQGRTGETMMGGSIGIAGEVDHNKTFGEVVDHNHNLGEVVDHDLGEVDQEVDHNLHHLVQPPGQLELRPFSEQDPCCTSMCLVIPDEDA